jgi:CubicO group peptidase (beta-lactamase class C family)
MIRRNTVIILSKKITKTALLFTLFMAAFITATNAFGQQKAQKIDALLKQYYDYGQFNGAVLVADGGKVIYKKGFGMANMEWSIPNQPDTKFRIASITKQFTLFCSSSRRAGSSSTAGSPII